MPFHPSINQNERIFKDENVLEAGMRNKLSVYTGILSCMFPIAVRRT